MNEFIEKLIGRLKKEQLKGIYDSDNVITVKDAYGKSISIVNQLAEEHKDNVMINEQYCWQTCGATEHCKECNRLCNGNIDYYENYDCLLEE